MLSEKDEHVIDQVRAFVKQEFIAHPHYSFDHWSVMYDHSCKVEEIARQIAIHIPCDELLVSLGALLHDIGKTHEADSETLHMEHESFNLPVSETFLETLDISRERLIALKKLVSYQSEGDEMRVMKDADTLALYADKRLYTLYIEWACREHLQDSIQRKLDKFRKLRFEVSREMGQKWFEAMERDWSEYQRNQ